jgi:hypothetical protein
VTIGHVLQDDTEEAVLISKDAQQVVSIPTQFRRINGKPKSLNKEMDDQLREVGCVSIPPGTPIRCEIPELDCGCLYDYLGARRPRYYNDPTIDRRYFGMLETDHIQSVAGNYFTVYKLGGGTGLTTGYLSGQHSKFTRRTTQRPTALVLRRNLMG